MMRFKESTGRPVVSLANAESIGRISRFVIDVPTHRVSAVQLDKTKDKHQQFLTWETISAFGEDAITVADISKIVEGDEAQKLGADKHHQVIGKRALSTFGDELGTITDVEFDPETGLLQSILYDSGEARGDHLKGIGSYAVILGVEAN
ncbi:MAG: PRC-barrel domain-containing protein [Antricoccus sp.]